MLISGQSIEDNVQVLYQAFQQLNPKEQEILHLRIIRGLSWSEVGEQLLLSKGVAQNPVTLRQQGYRALTRLRKLFHSLRSHDPDNQAA